VRTRVLISDLHLQPAHPERGPDAKCQRVVRFLDGLDAPSTHLYILGDFFDFWIGDRHAQLPDYRGVLDALARFRDRGGVGEFLHGNRDFLAGRHLDALGFRVRSDPQWEDWPSGANGALRRIHLCHGDLLCARDRSYQRYRTVARSWWMRALLRAVPDFVVFWLARRVRRYSADVVQVKKAYAMDADPAATRRVYRRGADVIVCGHIHQLRDLSGDVDGRRARFFCLGTWDGAGASALTYDPSREAAGEDPWRFVPIPA
jgi:UDP-2,3-diacylglucosamine hydrolase